MKIVAISDTHNRHKSLTIPPCDILIHAGDATSEGYEWEVKDFAKWFDKQPADHKIWVPGNHELMFENNLPASKLWFQESCPDGHLLIDEAITIMGVKFYGSPCTPYFLDWAFNRARNPSEAIHYGIREIKDHWDAILLDTNVLITHGPPYNILDEVPPNQYCNVTQYLGCKDLAEAVLRVKPDLHIFGHIHACGGHQVHQNGTSHYNVAICDEQYKPTNPVTIIDYLPT